MKLLILILWPSIVFSLVSKKNWYVLDEFNYKKTTYQTQWGKKDVLLIAPHEIKNGKVKIKIFLHGDVYDLSNIDQ